MNDLIQADWLHNMDAKEDTVLLDVSPASNKSGLQAQHPGKVIPGAIKVGLKSHFSDLSSELPNTVPSPKAFENVVQSLGINKQSKVIIYDNLGIYSAPRLWYLFKAMGHDQVAVLDGGLDAWIEMGGATVDKHRDVHGAGDFEANFEDAYFKTAKAIYQDLEEQSVQVIDARSEGRFCALVPEPRKGLRGGHIPHSKNLPFKHVLENGRFKKREALEAIFKDLDIRQKMLTFSCGSGLTACIILMAAHLIGRTEYSIYDGSWTEWAQLLDYPVDK